MLLSLGLYSICLGLTPTAYPSLTELEDPSITAIKPLMRLDCWLTTATYRSPFASLYCNAVGGAFKFMMSSTVFVELSITVTEFEPALAYVDLVIRRINLNR